MTHSHWTDEYIRMRFKKDGRERPFLDCYGLYRLIWLEQLGIELPLHYGYITPLQIMRQLRVEEKSENWIHLRDGEEQPFDLVFMKGMEGKGRDTIMAPLHVGCVVGGGVMIDIEEGRGVRLREYRSHPVVRERYIAVGRPAAHIQMKRAA